MHTLRGALAVGSTLDAPKDAEIGSSTLLVGHRTLRKERRSNTHTPSVLQDKP